MKISGFIGAKIFSAIMIKSWTSEHYCKVGYLSHE